MLLSQMQGPGRSNTNPYANVSSTFRREPVGPGMSDQRASGHSQLIISA